MNQLLEFLKRVSAVAGTLSKIIPRFSGLLVEARDEFNNLKQNFKPLNNEQQKEKQFDRGPSAGSPGIDIVDGRSLFPEKDEPTRL